MYRASKGMLRALQGFGGWKSPPSTPILKSPITARPKSPTRFMLKYLPDGPSVVANAITSPFLLSATRRQGSIGRVPLYEDSAQELENQEVIRCVVPSSKDWTASQLLQVFDHGMKKAEGERGGWSGVVEGESGVQSQQAWRWV